MSAVASPDWVWMRLSLGWMDQVRRLHQERVTNLAQISPQAVESDFRTNRIEVRIENQAALVPQRALLPWEEQESAAGSYCSTDGTSLDPP